MRALPALAALLASAGLAGAAYAHHGWSDYDATKQQKLSGAVAELKWEQPHAVLWIDQAGKKQEVWLSPLQRMVDRGLKPTALKVGTPVTVEAQPSSSQGGEWKALSITVDGKLYDLMPSRS
jgi:hypothetical protein